MARPIKVSAMFVGVLLACNPPREQVQSDAGVENLVLVQRYLEEFDANPSLDVVDQWLAPNFVSHEAGASEPHDLAAYRETLTPFFTGFSEIHHEVRQSVSDGDRIALLIDIRMRHTGEFAGIQATGRTIAVTEMMILRIENGKIAEEWIVFDAASLMQQLAA